MNEENTIGLTVMVSPVLWTSDYAGKTGTIEFTDLTNDKIWLRFEDEEVDHFSSRILFMLRACEELDELAEKNRNVQWPPVFQNLQTLSLLQASGSAKQLKIAFALLLDDPELHRLATIRLNEVIVFAPKQKTGR